MNRRIEVNEPNGHFSVVDKPIPEPPPKGLVLKTHYAGICHSDIHIWKDYLQMSDTDKMTLSPLFKGPWPRVFGHEVCGEIYKVGTDCKLHLPVGSRVMASPWQSCGECSDCQAGFPMSCPTLDERALGHGVDGGYQAYVVISRSDFVYPLSNHIPMESACLLGCSGLTAFNAVSKIRPAVEIACKRKGHASVLVIGAGGLGLWTLQWAKAVLPEQTKVFIADIKEEKLDTAKEEGADGVILWSSNASLDAQVAQTKEAMSGGIDGSVDLFGHPTTVNTALGAADKGASLAIAGLAGGTASLNIVPLAINGITVHGVCRGTPEQLTEMMEVLERKQIRFPPCEKVMPGDVEAALNRLMASKVKGRQVIDFTRV